MLGLLLGACVGVGAVVALSAFWAPLPKAPRPAGPKDGTEEARVSLLSTWQIPAALVSAVLGWMLTGWAPLGIAVAVVVLVGPALASSSDSEAEFAARTEAVAAWSESLRDTMRGARGIEAAIRVTADNSPVAIRGSLQQLNRRVAMGVPVADAMADCADEVDSPVFDLMAAVMMNALSVSAAQVPAMLDDIAVQARERAHSHLQVHTSRSKQRTELRLVGMIVIVTIAGFIALFGSYLEPLGNAPGQALLSVAAMCVGALLWWIASLSAVRPSVRMLDPRRAIQIDLTAVDTPWT